MKFDTKAAVLVQFLLPETIVRESGAGPALDLGPSTLRTFLVTLGITDVIEQESIAVTVAGSEDGIAWNPEPLLSFPQKFYAGISCLFLDLEARPQITHIRAEWKTNRWGRGDKAAVFKLYLFVEEAPVKAD